jgi:hypothetical protein
MPNISSNQCCLILDLLLILKKTFNSNFSVLFCLVESLCNFDYNFWIYKTFDFEYLPQKNLEHHII